MLKNVEAGYWWCQRLLHLFCFLGGWLTSAGGACGGGLQRDRPERVCARRGAAAAADIQPTVERRTAEFLKALNSGGGKPIEQLSPADARKVLEANHPDHAYLSQGDKWPQGTGILSRINPFD